MEIIEKFFSRNLLFLGLSLTLAIYLTLVNWEDPTVSAQLENTSTMTDTVLSSWNPGKAKEQIMNFVENINIENSKYYIPAQERIAVFDNDRTLWSEKPIPFQGFFALNRLEELYKNNTNNNYEIKNDSSLVNKILNKNISNLNELTEKDIMNALLITHSNISEIEFNDLVSEWAKTAKHPITNKKYVDMVYQPMLELLDFLKENEFKIFIVYGGGVDFMRAALSEVYGIPSDQIIGSSGKYQFIDQNNINKSNIEYNGTSFILKTPELNSFNNDYQKPANIQLHIGKVPIMAVGNSDGDLQMMEYVADNNKNGKSLSVLIHHDDAQREFSYDKGAENVLKEAQERKWITVNMKTDFKNVYPDELDSGK